MELSESDFKSLLKNHYCLEPIDVVSGAPEITHFRRRARLHQSLWREARAIKIGSQPMRKIEGQKFRPLGSRIDLDYAKESNANFLSREVWKTVENRLSNPQDHQTINRDRLYCDLLSSMPMCFNLFGILKWDLELADRVVREWWPFVPGHVCAVHFEWSPGRRVTGEYLENRSAFDVAFEIELDQGGFGILGIETKYHEYCKKEKSPSDERQKRYKKVNSVAEILDSIAVDEILGSDLQQIWLDHLLALSMLQPASAKWNWAGFVLIYPAKNLSYANATNRYQALLNESTSFHTNTLESLLTSDTFPKDFQAAFKERYLW